MIFGGLFPDLPASEHTALAAEKERLFRAQLGVLSPTPGVARILSYARQVGARTAVVTNAPRENATAMLTGLRIADCLDTIVIGGELAQGKPHPTPYLTALEVLDAAAEDASGRDDSHRPHAQLCAAPMQSGAGVSEVDVHQFLRLTRAR